MGSLLLLGGAGVFWLAAVVTSWSAECPDSALQQTGLDKGISLLPPGSPCFAEGTRGSYTYLAHPWLWSLAQAMVVASAVVIVLAVLVAVFGSGRRKATEVTNAS